MVRSNGENSKQDNSFLLEICRLYSVVSVFPEKAAGMFGRNQMGQAVAVLGSGLVGDGFGDKGKASTGHGLHRRDGDVP